VKLATIRTAGTTRAVKVDGDVLADLGAADLGEFLSRPDWAERAAMAGKASVAAYGPDADFAPLVPRPSKIVCVGLNYRNHILEMGRDLPDTGGSWELPGNGTAAAVSLPGPLADVAAYLTGRAHQLTTAYGAAAPDLAPWL